MPGNAPGVGTLVEIRMGKAHRERSHFRLAGGKRGDEARIQSPRKQQADRYVGNQMLRRHFVERGMEILLDIARLDGLVTHDFRVEVALELGCPTRAKKYRGSLHAVQIVRPSSNVYRIPETDRSRGDQAKSKPGNASKALSSDANTMPPPGGSSNRAA